MHKIATLENPLCMLKQLSFQFAVMGLLVLFKNATKLNFRYGK